MQRVQYLSGIDRNEMLHNNVYIIIANIDAFIKYFMF